MRIVVEWYGPLRDDAGRAEEEVEMGDSTLLELYEALERSRHLSVPASLLRVALDDRIAEWSERPAPGTRVVFLPPVGGG